MSKKRTPHTLSISKKEFDKQYTGLKDKNGKKYT
jgi:hypothetical protein